MNQPRYNVPVNLGKLVCSAQRIISFSNYLLKHNGITENRNNCNVFAARFADRDRYLSANRFASRRPSMRRGYAIEFRRVTKTVSVSLSLIGRREISKSATSKRIASYRSLFQQRIIIGFARDSRRFARSCDDCCFR
jgi:hypothetical protein